MAPECTILAHMTLEEAQKLRDGMLAAADAIGDNDRNAANAYRDCANRVNRLCKEAPKRAKTKHKREPRPPEAPQPYMGEPPRPPDPAPATVVDRIKGVFGDD